jgi:Flp pilus assembly protein TadD
MAARSILTPGQKRFLTLLLVVSGLVLATSGYLFLTTPAPSSSQVVEHRYAGSLYGRAGAGPIGLDRPPPAALPRLYQGVLLAHIFGGLALIVPMVVFIVWHLGGALPRRRRRTLYSGIGLSAGLLFLAVSGLFILSEANSKQHEWIYRSHQILALAAPLGYLAHRLLSFVQPRRRQLLIGFGLVAATTLVLVVVHYLTVRGLPVRAAVAAESKKSDLFAPFRPVNGVPGPESRFFPSQATTITGQLMPRRTLTLDDLSSPELIRADLDRYGFVVNDSMGSATCGRCHPSIVAQWARSTHRFSSFNNPFYRASVENLRSEAGGHEKSQWCGGCHDPVLMFAGRMKGEVDPLWPEAQAGLTCLSCHAMDHLHNKAGNGNYVIADEGKEPYLFAAAKEGPARVLHDLLVKSKPTVHKQEMLKTFYRTPEFCGTCHKVALDVPVNNYRWLRGQNEYDNWHDSGVAQNASRTFYLPEKKRVCQDCHMPLEPATLGDVSAKNGMVRSHRFLAANTALPFLRGDDEEVAMIEKFLRDAKLRVDVFALRRDDGTVVQALDRARPAVRAGEAIDLHVVVRNQGVGHTFPGGTLDSNESWVQVTVRDPSGAIVFQSGGVGANEEVDPDAHFYKVLFVDGAGEPALVRDPQHFHAPVYARVIGPGTADVARYRIRMPAGLAGGELTVEARVLWRKFASVFNRFVFARTKLPKLPRFDGRQTPALPISTIAESTLKLKVVAAGAPAIADGGTDAPAEDWVRFNDYGIANLLQGDTRSAAAAFARVAAIAPKRVDGPRNLARVALAEGNLPQALAQLKRCEELAPGDGQTAWLWGQALQESGKLDQAEKAYGRVLAYFPEDRNGWRELGRTRYLNGDYQRALEAFIEVLRIEPEDRVAHYYRMLCYRALGQRDRAEDAEKAYLKYQIDESAAEVTQRYRLSHEADNRESQKLHVHEPPAPL